MAYKDRTLHDGESGSALAIRLNPLSEGPEVSRLLNDGTVEIKLKGAGEDLNEELREFLARMLKIPKGRITVLAGRSKLEKLVSIIDMEPQKVEEIILRNMG